MDWTLGVALLIILYFLYVLLIRGLLYKIILCVFGWGGMYYWLSTNWQLNESSPFKDNYISWAALVPTVIVLMAMAYTREE